MLYFVGLIRYAVLIPRREPGFLCCGRLEIQAKFRRRPERGVKHSSRAFGARQSEAKNTPAELLAQARARRKTLQPSGWRRPERGEKHSSRAFGPRRSEAKNTPAELLAHARARRKTLQPSGWRRPERGEKNGKSAKDGECCGGRRPMGRRRQGQDRRLAFGRGGCGGALSGRAQRRPHPGDRRRDL